MERSTLSLPKINVWEAPRGARGQLHLVEGEHVRLRLWNEQPGDKPGAKAHACDYEYAGYVIAGRATLTLGDEVLSLAVGDSYLVPAGVLHRYVILEPLTAVEAVAVSDD